MRIWEVTWRLALVVAAVVIIGMAAGGCGGGEHHYEQQEHLVERAQRACANHEGIGYLNFSYYNEIDELACGDGYRLYNGKVE